jgi:flagellar hook-length control protein FliK
MQIEYTTYDSLIQSTSNTGSGEGEQADVFAEIFNDNIEWHASEPTSSPEHSSENLQEKYETEETQPAQQDTAQDEIGLNETENETQNEDQVNKDDSQAMEQPGDSQEEVADESEPDKKSDQNNQEQPALETTEPVELLQQLAVEPLAQKAQQQVATTVKTETKIPMEATPVKTMVSEPVATDAGASKVQAKALTHEANMVTRPTAKNLVNVDNVDNVVDVADEKVVMENSVKVVGKDVALPRRPVDVSVDQKVTTDFEEAEPEQVKPVVKNFGESRHLDNRHLKNGPSNPDWVQANANADVDADAKVAAGSVVEVMAKEKISDGKKGDSPLVSSMRETSVGKVDLAKGAATESKPAAESLVSREQVDQVVKAARIAVSRGSSLVQLRLDPPELGHLRIEIKQTSSGLQLQLQATTVKAQQLLEQTSTHLRSALESQGFQTVQVEVQLRMDLRNDQAMDQQADKSGQEEGFDSQESFSEDLEDMLEDQLTDSSEEKLLTDEPIQEPESPLDSPSSQGWREMEFSNLNVVA